MTSPAPLIIEAVVDDAERPALVAAFEQLSECLGAASGIRWPVQLRFRRSIDAIDLQAGPAVVVASLMPEVARREEPLSLTAQRWQRHFSSLVASAVPAVFVCTVFRYVADERAPERLGSPVATIERIRRLNLLAAELSHDTGIGVIDIDLVFAHIGARAIQTDYRLAGPIAAEVAGHAVVSGILAVGLDEFIPLEIQERAKQFQGGISDIGALVRRRLKQSASRAGSNGSS